MYSLHSYPKNRHSYHFSHTVFKEADVDSRFFFILRERKKT